MGREPDLMTALAQGGRAQNTDGDLRASRLSFERAHQLAEQADDVEAMAIAALGLAGLWVRESRTVTTTALLETRLQLALSRLEAGSELALRIRVRLAGEADYLRGDHADVLGLVEDARKALDPVVLAEALSVAHHCLLGPDHIAARTELAAELIKVSFRTNRRSDLLMGLMWRTVDAYGTGDPHAGRFLGELRGQLHLCGHLAASFVVSAIEVMLAIRAGRFEEAESLAGVCAEHGAAAGDPDADWWSMAQLLTIRWYQGRIAELFPVLVARADSPVPSAVDNSAFAALAVAAAVSGDRNTAVSLLATLCGDDLGRLPRGSTWLVTMHGVVEAAWLLGDTGVASRAYELLLPYAALPMVGSLGVTCFGVAQHALGVAAMTANRPDAAIGHLRAAVRQNLALAHWSAVVASRQRLSQAYLMRGHTQDPRASRRELELAIDEAADLGLPLPGQATERPPVPQIPGPRSAVARAECGRAGRNWRLALGSRQVVVADSVGMAHLAVLIANPRQELRAADLVAGVAGVAGLGTAAGGGVTAQPVLDSAAIGEYRDRVRRLTDEIDELSIAGQPQEAAKARAERDWLVAELASAAGFGGRTRSFADEGERARVSAGKAIRRAISRIAEADDVIGEHLRQTVHTGMRCSYWPG